MDVIMKTIKVIDEDTLEMREIVVEDDRKMGDVVDELTDIFSQALNNDPDVFGEKYRAYKKAK